MLNYPTFINLIGISPKDKSATDKNHYALRDRYVVDYNEERLANKQCRLETSKRNKHDDRDNFIEVCPTEICRKCWSKINYFEIGDCDLSADEYEERY